LEPRKKLEFIADRANVDIDFGELPFQDFGEMFKFRKQLVHAKPLTMTVHDVEVDFIEGNPDIDQIPGLQADWEKHCNVKTAMRWHKSVQDMTDRLCKSVGCMNPIHTGYASLWQY
jgi:hypothetical protein